MATLAELFTLADGVLLIVLVTISIVELRTGLIPNGLVLGAVVAWLATTAFTGGWSMSIAGAALALISALVAWDRGYLGAGVAKAALPIGGLLSLVGAAVVVLLTMAYGIYRYLREPLEPIPVAPRLTVFAILFIAGRAAFAIYGG